MRLLVPEKTQALVLRMSFLAAAVAVLVFPVEVWFEQTKDAMVRAVTDTSGLVRCLACLSLSLELISCAIHHCFKNLLEKLGQYTKVGLLNSTSENMFGSSCSLVYVFSSLVRC